MLNVKFHKHYNSEENWFWKRVIWSTKGFINCRRLEVLWRGWNLKIPCGEIHWISSATIHSISSAWILPAAPFLPNLLLFGQHRSMADFIIRTKASKYHPWLLIIWAVVMMMVMMMMMIIIITIMIICSLLAFQPDPSPHQIIQRLFMDPPSYNCLCVWSVSLSSSSTSQSVWSASSWSCSTEMIMN